MSSKLSHVILCICLKCGPFMSHISHLNQMVNFAAAPSRKLAHALCICLHKIYSWCADIDLVVNEVRKGILYIFLCNNWQHMRFGTLSFEEAIIHATGSKLSLTIYLTAFTISSTIWYSSSLFQNNILLKSGLHIYELRSIWNLFTMLSNPKVCIWTRQHMFFYNTHEWAQNQPVN